MKRRIISIGALLLFAIAACSKPADKPADASAAPAADASAPPAAAPAAPAAADASKPADASTASAAGAMAPAAPADAKDGGNEGAPAAADGVARPPPGPPSVQPSSLSYTYNEPPVVNLGRRNLYRLIVLSARPVGPDDFEDAPGPLRTGEI